MIIKHDGVKLAKLI